MGGARLGDMEVQPQRLRGKLGIGKILREPIRVYPGEAGVDSEAIQPPRRKMSLREGANRGRIKPPRQEGSYRRVRNHLPLDSGF